MTAAPILLRPREPGDDAHIFATWLRSYSTSKFARVVAGSYWKGHHRLVERLLARSRVDVVAWAEDASIIAGWACHAPGTVHYVYVGEGFRRQGVARLLLTAMTEPRTYTHRSRMCSVLPIPTDWKFDPYAALV